MSRLFFVHIIRAPLYLNLHKIQLILADTTINVLINKASMLAPVISSRQVKIVKEFLLNKLNAQMLGMQNNMALSNNIKAHA